jgi:phenylpyruvate tautomerase PptA (4-oxalocrotonate tautomerase family)
MFEEALDGEVEPATIRALTDALVEVYGERARELTVVEIFGIPRHRWGIGGAPAGEHHPTVTLHMREPALHLVDAAPERLIGSITDAMAGVLGAGVRAHVAVTVVGIPTGRSGVAGQPV